MRTAAFVLGIIGGLYGLVVATIGAAASFLSPLIAGTGSTLLYLLPLASLVGAGLALTNPRIAAYCMLSSAAGWLILGFVNHYVINAVTIAPLMMNAVGGVFALEDYLQSQGASLKETLQEIRSVLTGLGNKVRTDAHRVVALHPSFSVSAHLNGTTVSYQITSAKPSCTVGRGTEGVDMRVAHSTVSRHHARIELRGSEIWVTDLKSSNGTRVGGVALQQSPMRASPPCDLQVGSIKLVITIGVR